MKKGEGIMSIAQRLNNFKEISDNWEIGESIGSGSCGRTTTYRIIRKTKNNTFVEECALKAVTIIEETGKKSECTESFLRDYVERREKLVHDMGLEIALMYKLRDCPNIVTYKDYMFNDWEDETGFGCDLYIRMDFYNSLRKRMHHERFSDDMIAKVGIDICRAMEACHKKSIIHRDIKPDNIFINANGDFLLGDFGISKIVDELNRAETRIGTYEYAAPEVVYAKEGESYDESVDIYSLGLVLYELANNGKLPFCESIYAGSYEVGIRLRGKPVPKPSGCGKILGEIILKACAFDKENRYQNAGMMGKALSEIDSRKIDTVSRLDMSEELYQTLKSDTFKTEKESSDVNRKMIAGVAICLVIACIVIIAGVINVINEKSNGAKQIEKEAIVKQTEVIANDSSKADFGNISVGLNSDMTDKSKDIILDNDNSSQKVQYYIKVTGKSGVKGITVFWGRYVDGELRETGNTTRVTKEGEGLYSSYCVLQSRSSETGVYKMSKIMITDDNDMTYFFYNPAFKEYANKQNTFNADFVLNVNNSIDPDKLSLYCFGFVNEALDTMNQTITVKKVPGTKVLVPFRIETKAINNEISLKNVYFETVDSNGKVTDYQTVGALQKNVDYYDGKIMLIEDGWPAGKYKINKIKLISSDGKEYSYSVEDGSFTVNMGRNNTLIVKENDRIEPEETGVAPVSKPVEKSNDGTAKAEVKVDDKQELAVEKDDLDDAAKKCAEEEYTFNIESKAIPDNTTIEIGKVLAGNIYDNVKAAIESVVLDVKKDIRVFEINLLNTSGNKIQPDNNGNVTITTNIPDGFDPLKIEVYRLSDDGKDKIKVSAKAENGKVTFVTNHFSTYIIAQTAAQGQIIVPTPDPDDIWDTEDEENSVIIASEERPAGSATTIKDKSPATSDSAPVVVLLLVFVSAVALFGMCVSKRIIK